MDDALQGVTADPDPDWSVRLLADGDGEHDDRDDGEGEVPGNVEGDDGLRVAPVCAPLLQLERRRLADQRRRASAAAAGGAAEEERESGVSVGRRVGRRPEEGRRLGLGWRGFFHLRLSLSLLFFPACEGPIAEEIVVAFSFLRL